MAIPAQKALYRKKEQVINYFENIWKSSRPLYRMFSTEKYHYLYDTGTNNIFCCDEIVNAFLRKIDEFDIREALDYCISSFSLNNTVKSLKTLKETIDKYSILKYFFTKDFGLFINFKDLAERINSSLRMIQLEMTDQCNLRCGYCVYDEKNKIKRNHGKKNMTKETAYKAVKYLFDHSYALERVSISFYGGEPLINFGLIKDIVNYSKELFRSRIHFSITTNATLVNSEIAKYLANNEFNVLISLDGPQVYHDLWRKDIRRLGSYHKTVNGLKLIVNAFEDRLMKLGLSMVYAPPYSEGKIDEIALFIENNDWIPKRIMMTYPSMFDNRSHGQKCNKEDRGLDFSLSNWIKKRFFNDYVRNVEPHPLAASLLESKLARLIQRPIFDKPIPSAYLNGCCIPGGRKGFVTLEGKIHICERIGQAPDIGDIYHGMDIDVIKKSYYDDYANKSLPHCRNCWLVKLCDLCYRNTFYNYDIDMNKKSLYCSMKSMMLLDDLSYYCALLEIDPNRLDYLYDFEFR